MAASPKPGFVPTKQTHIAGFTLLAIPILLKYALHFPAPANDIPLFAAPLVGGVPMVWELLKNCSNGNSALISWRGSPR